MPEQAAVFSVPLNVRRSANWAPEPKRAASDAQRRSRNERLVCAPSSIAHFSGRQTNDRSVRERFWAAADAVGLLVPGCSCARRASLGIERLRGHISAVRPCDGPRLDIDCHAREVIGIAQGFKDTSPLAPREVDLSHCSVVECQAQLVLAADLDTDDVMQCSTKTMLRQSIDRLQRLIPSCALPVRRQFVLMQGCPLNQHRLQAPSSAPGLRAEQFPP
jgi:hypothetical protein